MIKELTSDDERIDIGTGTYATTLPLLRLHHPDNRIIIGKYCSFGEGVTIFAGGNHPVDFVTTHPLKLFFGKSDMSEWSHDCGDDSEHTVIGNDVWLGHQATILSGSTIGDGAIIGAKSVVRGNIPSYAIVIGNPAKVIRYRFDDEIIEELLKICWWNWPEEKVRKYAEHIASPNISSFLKSCSGVEL